MLCREEAFPELITLSLGVLASFGLCFIFGIYPASKMYFPVGLFHESLTSPSIGTMFYELLSP